jgi:hypothetical protein
VSLSVQGYVAEDRLTVLIEVSCRNDCRHVHSGHPDPHSILIMTACTLGKSPVERWAAEDAKSCDHAWEENDVCSRSKEDRCSTESTMGED